jgi:PIN domain nuclease of toxin-antitoxin system
VNLLLDTHVWVWTQEAPERIGPATMVILAEGNNTIFVSTISTLEIARLVDGGLLAIKGSLNRWIMRSLELILARTIEVSHAVALEAYALPRTFHRDPADRLLVATARRHDLTLVTADERILAYPAVHTLDARV